MKAVGIEPSVTVDATEAWVDLASPSHPFFFAALLDGLDGVDATVTARRKTETVSLARNVGLDPAVLGRDLDNSLARKIGIPVRTIQLAVQAPTCDVSLSSRNAMAVLAAASRGVPSIHFTDNDITAYVDDLRAEALYNQLEAVATHNVVPAAFETAELTKRGAGNVHTYDGYKEDVYVASFTPDPSFTDRLPFEEYVVVRPEALTATYVEGKTIVPSLLDRLVARGRNVVYLPRGRGDKRYAEPFTNDRVYVPDDALDGLQLAWHASCVATGSGTMAREAAAMDKPAVSFFPSALLSVDRELVREGWMFHSRDPGRIVDFVEGLDDEDRRPDRSRARESRQEVIELVAGLIDEEVGP